MPEMDGIEATQKIRAHKRFKALPIIAMTAHAMAEERQKCLDAGMQDHITKPIDPDSLYRTLAAWCKSRDVPNIRPAPSTPEAGIEEIPPIEGLDTAGGLMRVSGKRKLYRKLLRQYVESQGGAAQEIRARLATGDRKTAERIAHTAKGVSGNIGASAVRQADRKSTRLNSSHIQKSRMPSSA